jgi:hypothetical protein
LPPPPGAAGGSTAFQVASGQTGSSAMGALDTTTGCAPPLSSVSVTLIVAPAPKLPFGT